MEYVDGEDLASLLRRIGRLPQDKALQIARQLCAGLAAAHERGVLHRDLKPANVMIDGAGTSDHRLRARGAAGRPGEDIRSGTPAYMAPEQLAGREVTRTSDIYALGLVLYELFTGKRAVRGGRARRICRAARAGRITPPSIVVRDLDPAVERVILRCLEHDPGRSGRRPRSRCPPRCPAATRSRRRSRPARRRRPRWWRPPARTEACGGGPGRA